MNESPNSSRSNRCGGLRPPPPFVGSYSAVVAVGAAALFTDVLTDIFTGVFTDVFTDVFPDVVTVVFTGAFADVFTGVFTEVFIVVFADVVPLVVLLTKHFKVIKQTFQIHRNTACESKNVTF